MIYHRAGLVRKLNEVLRENPSTLLKDAARELKVERHTIQRMLREEKGLSYREYRQRLLLSRALKLLTSKPNWSIKMIAAELSYSSESFARFIRQNTGRSPAEIREIGTSPAFVAEAKFTKPGSKNETSLKG